MKNKISQLLRNIVRRIRYRHPLSKIAIFAIPFLLVLIVYFFRYLLPLASATSIQAGLTLVAEILGVLLGAAFVIIVFLAERLREAETLLSKAFPNYRQMIIEDADGIFDAKEQLAEFVLEHKFTDEETLADFKKCMSALSQLTVILGDGFNEKQLEKLCFSEDEINEVRWAQFITIEEMPPDYFFRLLGDGFSKGYFSVFMAMELKLNAFWGKYHMPMMQDGIFTILDRYEFSHNILNSWLLSVAIAVNIMSLLVSVFTTFSVTETTFHYPSVMLWIYVSLIGFLLSMLLLSFSLHKTILVGVEK